MHRGTRRVGLAALLLVLLFPAVACQRKQPSGADSTPGPSPTARTSTPSGGSTAAITVTSTAFRDGAAIPARYSCREGNRPPPLAWRDTPAGAARLALVMDDPDAVGGRYVHWVVTDIPRKVGSNAEGQPPEGGRVSANSGGDPRYLGPCPPAGSGVHHYRFTVYALSRQLDLASGTPARDALAAIEAAATARGTLVGTYQG